MESYHGTATTISAFLDGIVDWATDEDIHGDDAFELMRSEPYPNGIILKAKGRRADEYQYIGLMMHEIVQGTTYDEWFFKKENFATYFMWAKPSEGGVNDRTDFILNGRAFGKKTDSELKTFGAMDNVVSSAYAIHIGVFKQYNDSLQWHEQPGGIGQRKLAIRPVQYSDSRGNKTDFVPPPMPGMGYPSLAFDHEEPIKGVLEYWLAKDDRSITIAICNGQSWQTAHAGFFKPYDSTDEYGSYAFPAIAIGYTSGLYSEGKDVWHSPQQESPTKVIGPVFDYSPTNWSLTHGNPNYSAVAMNVPISDGDDALRGMDEVDERNIASQTMAMLPDGEWTWFANYAQVKDGIPQFVCDGPFSKHHYVRREPARVKTKNIILPADVDIGNTAHTYEDGENFLNNIKYHMESLKLCHGELGLLGEIPRLFHITFPVPFYGEQLIGGKKYLIVPNGWRDRKFHMRGWASVVQEPQMQFDPEDIKNKVENYERLSRHLCLAIRLED